MTATTAVAAAALPHHKLHYRLARCIQQV